MKLTVLSVFLALGLAAAPAGLGADSLPALVRLLGETRDVQVQVDVLRGMRDALAGATRLPMPAGWEGIEGGLARSENAEVRNLSRMLGLKFGSVAASKALREVLEDRTADAGTRQEALRALVGVRDETLPARLRNLLTDPALRGAAVRALATFDDPANGPALLAAIPNLGGSDRRDALGSLASRPQTARALLAEIEKGGVPKTDLTAELVRQLRNLKDEAVTAALTRVYGAVREVSADKQNEIARYKRLYYAGGSTPGDAIRGRTVYAKICQQCHTLFEVGGKVGPDLTGSNRGDLDYILQNILDPNAVIPNEYQASTIDLKDGRVVTGIVQRQDDRSVVVSTANETLVLARSEIEEIARSQLSMMPEGLLQPLADQEYRDLIYYLGRSGQAPLLATADTANLFFNGQDLALWHGAEGLWSVEQGQIVARPTAALAQPEYLKSDLVVGDFRLVVRVRGAGEPGAKPASVVIRGEPRADGSIQGYRVVLTGRQAGLIEAAGGGGGGGGEVSAGKVGEPGPTPADGWTVCEIVALGDRVQTAVNGRGVADLRDPSGARQGLLALVLAAGERSETRWRDLTFEVPPKPGLTTVVR